MAERWQPLPLSQPLFANADPDAIQGFQTAIENGFITDQGGHSRFPGLKPFATLNDPGKVYLYEWGGNLVAGTSNGRVYTIDAAGRVKDRTGLPVSGGRRMIFADNGVSLRMAAGGPIVELSGEKTALLSPDAPLSSHVAYMDGYTIASEMNSGRFYHDSAGGAWDPLDTYAADGDPDTINALMVTPFRELMVGGRNSIEQFESSQAGDAPFFRRWSVGEGIGAPYCMLWAENAMWSVNKLFEVVRSSGQVAVAASGDIGLMLQQVDNWDDAWMGGYPDKPLHLLGQQFILMQIPHATNPYGSKGITLLYDYRKKRWSMLYDFDLDNGVPVRWPGWSHWSLWSRTFVGGEGVIYEVANDTYNIGGRPQRWLLRTGYSIDANQVQIKNLRLTIKRGRGSKNGEEGFIAVRCRRDHRPFGPWIRRSLGRPGEVVPISSFGGFGTAHSFQFEFSTSDDVPVELMKAEILTERVGH